MKNYIANERGDWATSAAYVKYSLGRSIHYGRTYTHGQQKGNEEDLCEALRCLGQGLHTLEDFAAHTNYCELALREMGFHNVFPHTGTATQINIHGHHVFPLVTGTFGMVDFFHSVLGEATDHFTQSEVNEMDIALGDAQTESQSNSSLSALTGLLGKIPGTKDLVSEAENLKQMSEAQETSNRSRGSHMGYSDRGFDSQGSSRAPGSNQPSTGGPGPGFSGMPDFNPQETVSKIYPILAFRDNVVRKLNSIIEKIPGLEAIIEKITETLTVFIMSLLAPFVRPLINAASKSLQAGSAGVVDASGKHQYEPWTDPHCTDPTHSLLSKDHFANVLNAPAGQVASAILKYVAPRVLYAWQHVDVPEHEVLEDCMNVFHHPALRNMHNEAHRTMYEAVQSWVNSREDRGHNLNNILSAEGVRAGRNTGGVPHTHGGGGGGFAALGGSSHGQSHGQSHGGSSQSFFSQFSGQSHSQQGHQSSSGLPWDKLSSLPIPGISNLNKLNKLSNLIPGGLSREVEDEGVGHSEHDNQQPMYHEQHQHHEHHEHHEHQHQHPHGQHHSQHHGQGHHGQHHGHQGNGSHSGHGY